MGVDVVVGAALAALTVAGMELALRRVGLPRSTFDDPLTLLLGLLVGLPMCWRRRFPVTSMNVSMASFMALGFHDPIASTTAPGVAAVFACLTAATAWARNRRLLAAGWIVTIVQLLALQIVTGVSNPEGRVVAVLQGTVSNGVYFGAAFLVGRTLYRSAATTERLQQTAAALLEEQELNARQSALAERLRIAREVHDVASQHISVSGVQAAAARRILPRNPEAADEAMRIVEESSRSAVMEMRDLLGVLRAPETDASAATSTEPGRQVSLDGLPELVQHTRETGVATTLEVVGRPVELAASTSSSLFRLVQESLANVRKHSTADHARVILRWPETAAGGAVEVEVLDDGTPKGGTSGSQLGHVGMRERAGLAGAHLEIGPRPLGGFRVFARYPVRSHDDPFSRSENLSTVVSADGRGATSERPSDPGSLEAHP